MKKVQTVEIVKNQLGFIQAFRGPEVDWPLPPYREEENKAGYFWHDATNQIVRSRENTDYGNGPGRAKSTVVHCYSPIIKGTFSFMGKELF